MNWNIMGLASGMRTLDDIRATSIDRRIDELLWNVLTGGLQSVRVSPDGPALIGAFTFLIWNEEQFNLNNTQYPVRSSHNHLSILLVPPKSLKKGFIWPRFDTGSNLSY